MNSYIDGVYIRLLFWIQILYKLTPTNLSTAFGLIISMIFDLMLLLLYPKAVPLPKGRFSGLVYSRKYGVRYAIRAGTDDIYLVLPGREGDVSETILQILSEGDTYVDVGANIGCYSIPASKLVGDNGHIIAVEAVPTTADALVGNCKLNGIRNVTVVNRASWDYDGEIVFSVSSGYYGLASANGPKNGELFSVPTARLDDICKDFPSIKLIKIDVEGSEIRVLRGARETLSKADKVIIELSGKSDEALGLLAVSSFSLRKMEFMKYWLAERNSTDRRIRNCNA